MLPAGQLSCQQAPQDGPVFFVESPEHQQGTQVDTGAQGDQEPKRKVAQRQQQEAPERRSHYGPQSGISQRRRSHIAVNPLHKGDHKDQLAEDGGDGCEPPGLSLPWMAT